MTINVLIINDHTEISESLDTLSDTGFSVQTISTNIDYQNTLRVLNPDVIIVDSPLSGPSNNKLFPSIRSVCKAPILVLSVIDKPGIVEKVLDRGADEYLVKPVSPNLLSARIKALARRSHTPMRSLQL